MVRLRKSTDFDLIDRLDKKIFPLDDPGINRAAIWWVLEVDGDVAGFCGLKVKDRIGYLCRAGLLPAHRGKGLQRDLIRIRDREAKKLGVVCNITYVAPSNWPSANNLIHCGYTLYDPQYAWGMKGALYFQKRFKER